jgi:hypothetical protein
LYVDDFAQVVIVREEDLSLLMFPSVLQQYHNHSEQLFKVYVIEKDVMVFCRPSLPTLPLHSTTHCNESYQSVAFDSRYCYPTIQHFFPSIMADEKRHNHSTQTTQSNPADSPAHKMQKTLHTAIPTSPMNSSKSWKLEAPVPSPISTSIATVHTTDTLEHPFSPSKVRRRSTSDVSENGKSKDVFYAGRLTFSSFFSSYSNHCYALLECFQSTAKAIQEEFGLTLFGFDVIIPQHPLSQNEEERKEIEIVVIDINYFPSYKEVEDFPVRLRDYLRRISMTGGLSTDCNSSSCTSTSSITTPCLNRTRDHMSTTTALAPTTNTPPLPPYPYLVVHNTA